MFNTATLIAGAILLSVVTSGYFYIGTLQAELETAAEARGKLEDAIKAKDLVMESQRKDLELQRQINTKISQDWNEAQKEKRDLEQKFKRVQSLAEAAAKNPSVTEQKINRGTAYALRCNEIVTGSPIVESDKANNICPDLIKMKAGSK